MKKIKIIVLQVLIVIATLLLCPIVFTFYITRGVYEAFLWVIKGIFWIFKSIYIGYQKGMLECLKLCANLIHDMIEHYDNLKGGENGK